MPAVPSMANLVLDAAYTSFATERCRQNSTTANVPTMFMSYTSRHVVEDGAIRAYSPRW